MQDPSRGEAFPAELSRQIKSRFHLVDRDFLGRERIYFENAGGSLRLKAATEAAAKVDAIPDSAERIHEAAAWLKQVQVRGTEDIRNIQNTQGGTIHASLTASGAMGERI